ncbi:TetR/AcrR family transcriptional regulator [bacterium]|nr:TetR/AcrR family transcriptional regulator [bacterium]
MLRPVFDRKGQILSEATHLFSQHGFDRVTVKQVAFACGITEPALYRHYRSKEELWHSVLDSLEKRLDCLELFERIDSESDLETILMWLAGHFLEFFRVNEDLSRLLLYGGLDGLPLGQKVFKKVRGTFVTFLIKTLDRLQSEQIIIPINSEITARCFVGMVFECAMCSTLWRTAQNKIYKPIDVLNNNIPIYVRGLAKNRGGGREPDNKK